MKYSVIMSALLCIPLLMEAQIKINNPYQKNKDKTYIPDSGESAPAPNPNGNANSDVGDQESAISAVVLGLFEAMHQSNGNAAKSFFATDARLLSTDANGKVTNVGIDNFARSISQAQRGSLEEKVTDMEIRVDQALAAAWVDYDFYLNGELHHCGVDAFQFVRTGSSWKIIQIMDTRRTECVAGGQAGQINNILDNWHAAASGANATPYFDLISKDGFYLGTDAGETWSKEEFYKFAKPFFDKGNAWKFVPKSRNVHFSEDNQISWFNEILDTWMGPCRGSGVMKKQANGQWKIMQYNLAILVPNDLVNDYVKMTKERR